MAASWCAREFGGGVYNTTAHSLEHHGVHHNGSEHKFYVRCNLVDTGNSSKRHASAAAALVAAELFSHLTHHHTFFSFRLV